MAFADFARRHLIALTHVTDDKVVFVPVKMGNEFGHILGLHGDYAEDTWVSFGSDGEVSAHISREDYIEYRETLTFDQLCESLGSLFGEFLDLTAMAQSQTGGAADKKIRERKDADARFSTARNQSHISHVVIWTGDGREREERKINLTQPQGLLLYHLPFPTAEPLSVADIMKKAGVDESLLPEILDIVEVLESYGVIEVQ